MTLPNLKHNLHLILFPLLFLFMSNPITARELSPKNFEVLTFGSIKPNDVQFNGGNITLKIKHSASPLIYPFTQPQDLKKIVVKGKITGHLNLKDKKQGDEGADDFTFRLGLVLEGERTLNFFERTIAPSWITKLYSLGKKANATGIKEIVFYNLVQDKALLGKEREHPLSELLVERFYTAPKEDGSFALVIETKDLPKEKVLALWISCDGDDTLSEYEITLTDFTLTP